MAAESQHAGGEDEAYIRRARTDSNAGFASHDADQIAAHWLPGIVVTQATLGEHTSGYDSNRRMLLDMFQERPDVIYQRHLSELKVSPELGFAWEEGRWQGQWTGPDGAPRKKSGVYFAQWMRQQQTADSGGSVWLLNSEVYAPTSATEAAVDQVEGVHEEIRTSRAKSNRAIAARSVDSIVQCWLPEICITHSTGEITAGTDVNRARFEDFGLRDVVFVRTAERIETDIEGGVAAELGVWDGAWSEPDGSKVRRSGKYMAQWRQQEGGGAPPPAAAAAVVAAAAPSMPWLINAEVFVLERHSTFAPSRCKLLDDWTHEIAEDPRCKPATPVLDSEQQPIGNSLAGFVPPNPPPPTSVLGRHCRLEPVEAARHAPSLHACLAADTAGSLWTYTGPSAFGRQGHAPTFAQVAEYLQTAESRGGVFVIVVAPGLHSGVLLGSEEEDGGVVAGTVAYQGVTPATASATIGHVVHTPLLKSTRAATEAHFLMLRQLFALGYHRVAWTCDALNVGSMRFAQRLGFVAEGVQRSNVVQERQGQLVGLSRASFSILQHEWFGPTGIGAAILQWLRDENFTEGSQEQRSRLSDLTASVRARL